MSSHYGQFCPVAKAMELLDERWTLLVVRELMMGSRHFNALRRGVPRMSPALLSKRLQTLVRAGVVERWEDGNRVTYQLTEAGKELEPIVEALGRWGTRWIPELGDEDLRAVSQGERRTRLESVLARAEPPVSSASATAAASSSPASS